MTAAAAIRDTRRVRPEWLLSCGHRIPLLEHESAGELPRRPRMCETCGRPRHVEAPATASGDELLCAECGARGRHGFRADYGADDRETPDVELVVFCATCWNNEFG
jgi:hypothetical protein